MLGPDPGADLEESTRGAEAADLVVDSPRSGGDDKAPGRGRTAEAAIRREMDACAKALVGVKGRLVWKSSHEPVTTIQPPFLLFPNEQGILLTLGVALLLISVIIAIARVAFSRPAYPYSNDPSPRLSLN